VTPLHSFGPKQQLAIIEIRGEQILLGVTQTSITRIAQWTEPVQITDDPLVDQ
jgi:flagellar biogenesis protein FliO